MNILGIDPGIARMGWGVIDYCEDGSVKYIGGGVFETPAGKDKVTRIYSLFTELDKVIEKYKICSIGLEKIFFSNNAKTAITVGECRGILFVLSGKFDIPLFEFTPNEIKEGLTGYGNADKSQVQKMVKLLLDLDFIPKPDDFADALGIAYCTASKLSLNSRLE